VCSRGQATVVRLRESSADESSGAFRCPRVGFAPPSLVSVPNRAGQIGPDMWRRLTAIHMRWPDSARRPMALLSATSAPLRAPADDRFHDPSNQLRRSPVAPPTPIRAAGPGLSYRPQTQLVAAVAERADMTGGDAKRALGALDEVVLEELGNAQKVRIGGLVQLTVRVKPAQKKRKGRNPATGEEIDIAAKPASVDLRARPLAKAKAALPSVQKARRRLAA
jgi:nucleoid DNA-binding protein